MICLIYEKIKELREKAGYSQSELARRLCVTRSSVNAWEMGISVPTTQYVVEMCHLFKVSSDYMLGINNSITMNLDEFSDEELKLIYHLIEYIASIIKIGIH